LIDCQLISSKIQRMPQEITVLIADAQRIPAVRAEGPIAGSVLYFSDSNLASALESIRAHNPKVVAIESHFAESVPGRAFVDRLRTLSLTGSQIRLLGRANGGWSTAPLTAQATVSDSLPAGLNTRRAPRFLVRDPAPTVIDGVATNLIDISVLGAQVLSEPVLRPKQRIKVTIVEDEAVLRFYAHVAWSVYEKARSAPTPHYRAGMEFDKATEQALKEFCRRHCSETPLPFR
jgi:PilZ domain-containing protein